MTAYVALLRGVNLGKRQLKMADLRRLATKIGLDDATTYIASGNLLFRSSKGEQALKSALEAALAEHMGARVGVMVRTAEQLSGVVAANPFGKEAPNLTVAIFLDAAPAGDAAKAAKNVDGERIRSENAKSTCITRAARASRGSRFPRLRKARPAT